jgi:hypothetical protein
VINKLIHALTHSSIGDQVAGAVVRSATSHSVGALMRGHSVAGVILIAVVLIAGVWVIKRLF